MIIIPSVSGIKTDFRTEVNSIFLHFTKELFIFSYESGFFVCSFAECEMEMFFLFRFNL